MRGRSLLPAICLVGGGLILAIAPWIDRMSPSVDPFSTSPVEGAWVVIVEETSERNPAVARVMADGEYWRGLEKRGVQWRFYDIDSPDAKSYAAAAKREGLPALLILGPDGKVLEATGLPATVDGIDEIVKREVRL